MKEPSVRCKLADFLRLVRTHPHGAKLFRYVDVTDKEPLMTPPTGDGTWCLWETAYGFGTEERPYHLRKEVFDRFPKPTGLDESKGVFSIWVRGRERSADLLSEALVRYARKAARG